MVSRPMSRRQFLAAGAGVAAMGLVEWTPAFVVPAGGAQSTLPTPPQFPSGIALYQQAFKNWSEEISLEHAWTCAPRLAADVVRLANWAARAAYEVRPRGKMHAWSPLSIPVGSNGANLVMADTTQFFTAVNINSASHPATVTVQPGVTMDVLLQKLEDGGLGLTAHPAPGDVTVGGVLACDGHGAAVPADGEVRTAGHTYGSLSNLVVSLVAVVWDPSSGSYVLRRFDRSDPAIAPLLTHVGRSFITEVKLQVGQNSRLRCASSTNVPAWELFGAPGSGPRTFDRYVAGTGRVEAIWFPFTSEPWLKVWSLSPQKPLASRAVTSPYNYVFADSVQQPVSDAVRTILSGHPEAAPLLGAASLAVSRVGLLATDTTDLWGWAKNLLLYVKPSTVRYTANGYAVLTSRASLQRVVHDFASFHGTRLAVYRQAGLFPVNGPVEIRVTGLDQPIDVEWAAAQTPQLSALRPRPDHPEWDVAVWIDVLTLPGTPRANQYYRELEQWMFGHYSGWAMVRPEWSKGWAYTQSGAWSDPTVLHQSIPAAFRVGQASGDDWDAAMASLDRYDPFRVFSNVFLDALSH